MRCLRRTLDALYMLGGVAGAVALAAIAVTIGTQVTLRQMGGVVPGADDFTSFMVAASALLPLAHTLRHGTHIRVDLILGRIRGAARQVLEVIVLTLAGAMACFLAWSMADLASDSFAFGDVATGTVAFRLWIPQTGIAIGCALFALALIDDLVVVLSGGTPSYARRSDALDERASEEI